MTLQTINGNTYNVVNGTFYHATTSIEIINRLEQMRLSGSRCRIFYGDIETGLSWNEEYDVAGTIGRSTGTIKVPLLIKQSNSIGGAAIMDHCIIGILFYAGCWSYKHPSFSAGNLVACPSDLPEYKSIVTNDGRTIARFKTETGATRYIDFLNGKRLNK